MDGAKRCRIRFILEAEEIARRITKEIGVILTAVVREIDRHTYGSFRGCHERSNQCVHRQDCIFTRGSMVGIFIPDMCAVNVTAVFNRLCVEFGTELLRAILPRDPHRPRHGVLKPLPHRVRRGREAQDAGLLLRPDELQPEVAARARPRDRPRDPPKGVSFEFLHGGARWRSSTSRGSTRRRCPQAHARRQ